MTKRLTLNEETLPFFDNENKQVWDLIIENKTEELLSLLPREDSENAIFDTIVKEILSEGKSETFDSFDFASIRKGNSILARELNRLVILFDINGEFEIGKESIIDKFLDSFSTLVEKIQVEAHGYPMRPVHETIITEAVGTRAALNMLAFYFKNKEDVEGLHTAIVLRTKLTLSIMSNYKNIVGHDMIETAKVKEQVGEPVAALGFYNAARENLKNELHWFVESPEMGPNEDDVIMLQALKEAYLSIDRLNNTSDFGETCSLIDEILSREYVEYNFDEDDDE